MINMHFGIDPGQTEGDFATMFGINLEKARKAARFERMRQMEEDVEFVQL